MKDLVLVIIDDEPKARELLKDYIHIIFPDNNFQFILCKSVEEGKNAIQNYLPDLVFLDIEMPEANGFELFKHVNKETFEVVFVTAYSEYIEKSVNEFGCFGYINKPIEREKLTHIFTRFKEKSKSKKHLKFINVKQNKRILVNFEEIAFFKAESNYSEIHMKDGKTKYLLTKTLKDIESEISSDFFYRVHRSYIINLHHVKTFEGDKNVLIFKEDTDNNSIAIPVSKKYKENIKKLYL